MVTTPSVLLSDSIEMIPCHMALSEQCTLSLTSTSCAIAALLISFIHIGIHIMILLCTSSCQIDQEAAVD